MSEPTEVGTSKEIKIFDVDHIVHIHGKPLEIARFIQDYWKHLEQGTGEELTQVDVAKHMREELGYNINQPQLSRYMSLLTLEPHFIEKIKEGNLKFTVAVALAGLPHAQRQEVLEIAEEYERERIYMYDVDEIKERHLVTDDILALLDHRDSLEEPYDPEGEVETPSRPSTSLVGLSESEWSAFVSHLKMRSHDGLRITPNDIKIYMMDLTPVKDLIQKITEKLEREGFKVY